jgi:hypothetical protein
MLSLAASGKKDLTYQEFFEAANFIELTVLEKKRKKLADKLEKISTLPGVFQAGYRALSLLPKIDSMKRIKEKLEAISKRCLEIETFLMKPNETPGEFNRRLTLETRFADSPQFAVFAKEIIKRGNYLPAIIDHLRNTCSNSVYKDYYKSCISTNTEGFWISITVVWSSTRLISYESDRERNSQRQAWEGKLEVGGWGEHPKTTTISQHCGLSFLGKNDPKNISACLYPLLQALRLIEKMQKLGLAQAKVQNCLKETILPDVLQRVVLGYAGSPSIDLPMTVEKLSSEVNETFEPMPKVCSINSHGAYI